MDELSSGPVDPEELMDLDEGDGSELDEDEEDVIDDTLPSPLQLPSSGPASTATSAASSPPTNDDAPPVFNFTGKPLNIKRGRGRPRREGGKPIPRRQSAGVRMKRWKPQGYSGRGMPKRVKSFDRDYESPITPSPGEEVSLLDPETGALILSSDRDKSNPHGEELPYAPEQWPGKVCAFCNLGERSQLGQGEMLRLTCPEGFIPRRIVSEIPDQQATEQVPERDAGDKSPRGPVTCRRQKSFNKCRHPSMTSEYVDELTIIGYSEEPDVTAIFESSGHFYVHRSCSLWSNGVIRKENLALDNVGQALLLSASKKCAHCNHYGASIACKKEGCSKTYHFPCATASGAFQELSNLLLFCSNHLMQAALMCEGSVCFTCKTLGDISNLIYCSICGEHYHGTCVGLAQMPGVRAGWQCRKCRVCQVCRMIGDETKLMACEQCDKVYHAMCQRPIVTSIPKYGWKCRCCRVCGDCGSRTPGAGLSSRWHSHYTVCDSCYQQRNKGYSCPLCHRAYRAHAYREMVQCVLCRKFVHGTCDPEADLATYHQRKEAHPEYEYVCSICKNRTQQGRPMLSKRNSTEDPGDSMSASQESLYDDVYEYDPERLASEDAFKGIGLGRGKPYSASKIAKKRLGLSTGPPGRPKGVGKGLPGKVGFMKRQRITDFGRKRGPKAKMRGIFGVPGVGLQRPVSDGSKTDEEPGVENRLILCSAKDKFVLTQDICVMCGALGTDQEGCLIACVQCGQCYHPYCVNVKVTKVILQKGWRCLDCTVCEGCGQRNDEGRLLLCDDCDISYHIYCMDPPLDYVPQGNWKCKWCVVCQTCGSTDPGFNCNWMNSFSECGPCASQQTCASCSEPYNDGDLIIQCVQCERWLHGGCDSIKSETDAEKCAEDGYNCILCRPRDVPPPHLLPVPVPKPPSPTKSPEVKSNAHYYIDGVYLSELGHTMIKSLCLDQQIGTRKKRKKISTLQDKEAGIMATIESVIAGSSGVSNNSLEDNAKLELIDVKDEPQELYKEGMLWAKEDGPTPEGFTLFAMENGMTVLRRKRQRNLQKLGIGGFFARVRGVRSGQDNDDLDLLSGQSSTLSDPLAPPSSTGLDDKPRRKAVRRKPKSKLAETFPPYLQEAFFGKELLDSHKDLDSTSGSEDESSNKTQIKSIQLSQDEIKAVAAVTAKQDKTQMHDVKQSMISQQEKSSLSKTVVVPKEEEESDTDDLSLALPRDLLDADLVNTIMNEEDDELTKNTDTLENLADATLPDAGDISDTLSGTATNSKDTKDELSDILGPHFNPETIPYINSKDVEDILFKGVLTDESQESQESNIFSSTTGNVFPSATIGQQPMVTHAISAPPIRPSTLPNVVNQNSLSSPLSFPPQSPYQSEYSNSPQFSPAFSEPPSPWVTVNDASDLDNAVVPSTYNQRSSEKMKADEGLGTGATISAVLYANINHPEWKNEHPSWSDRYKQIIKKWRTLSPEQKAPYLLQAKDNRSALRMKKQQQISSKESAGASAQSPGMAVPTNQHHHHQSTGAKASPAGAGGGNSAASPSLPVAAQQLLSTTTATVAITTPQQQQPPPPPPTPQPSQLPTNTIIQNSTNTATSTTFQQQQQQQLHLQKDHHHLHQQLHQIQTPEVCNKSVSVTVSATANNINNNRNNISSSDSNNRHHHHLLLVQQPLPQQQPSVHNQTNSNNGNNPSRSSQTLISASSVSSQSLQNVVSASAINPTNVLVASHAHNSTNNQSTHGTGTAAPTSSSLGHSSTSTHTQHQFTVHGTNHHFLGSSDHTGPAPNVTVNPHYQPIHGDPNPRPIPMSSSLNSSSSAAVDQQIRVLTPSEIMRTLPSLCQEGYEPPSPLPILDPEKSVQQQKSAREAEQERQWKQLQAIRQQQQQHQQQIIQEQRVQARVHRQISDGGTQQFLSPEQAILQTSPQQEIASPLLPTSPRTFNALGIKSPPTPFTHPASVSVGRPQTPSQQTVVAQDFIAEVTDPFSPNPTSTNSKTNAAPSNLRVAVDPYSHQPATPRPISFAATPRPALQGIVRQDGGNLEISHRQLKDLLQRQQQFKKLDEQLLPGKGQQRVWPPPENVENVEQLLIPPSSSEPTFRHPLPPAMRPRVPLPTPNVIRQPGGGIVGLRMQSNDPRLQGLRLILHEQQQQRTVSAVALQQQFPAGGPRFAQNIVRPAGVEQYEQIQRQVFQPRVAAPDLQAKLHLAQPQLQKTMVHQVATTLANVAPPTTNESTTGEQEIPDNVTAELEKLEQDGTMVELQGVGDLLGGLPEDDDELLAEMGNDFNILEYADPELDALTGGEKTNILDSLDLVEPEPVKEEKKVNKVSNTIQTTTHPLSTTTAPPPSIVKTEPKPLISSSGGGLQLPPLTVPQQTVVQQPPQPSSTPQPQLTSQQQQQQQLHQQMLQNVQQAAAEGRPFLARRILTREDIARTVMTNSNVTLNLPAGYPQQQLLSAQLQQLQMQKLQMRQNAMVQNPRLAGPVIHGKPARINVGAPPPPYSRPPPPYPGSTTPQMGLRMAGPNVVPVGPPLRHPVGGLVHPVMRPAQQQQQGLPMPMHQAQRRPLLLEEQPLLLQELLEEEQREQEKQLQTQSMTGGTQSNPETPSTAAPTALLSDHEFERLKADVLSSGPLTLGSTTTTAPPVQNILTPTVTQARPTFQTQVSNPGSSQSQWQAPPTPADNSPRVPTFNANFVPAPPLPPEHIVTEQDKQTQIAYEQWLNHQNMVLGQQLKFYEGEVQKLRKIRKSLNSKQRQLRKCGNQLAEADASELQRISTEQSILQKHLESSRKQSRQHAMLIQEYRNKQQTKQRPGPGQSPLLTQSPLGPPVSSPIHPSNTPQSPMMSPTASPMTQHNSPMHSPAPLISHSPGPGSVSSVLQSPGNPAASGMSPMQPSPRIGTPHSQSEGSPGPVQSPSQICLPPPMPRITSPQHRRVVTSPIGYAGDLRPGTPQALGQLRFARPPLDAAALQQRTRLQSPSPNFQQKPCTPSPLNSPPSQQMTINQQMLQRHLQQQALLQQQQQQQQQQIGENQGDSALTNRTRQLIQQRQLALRQQQLVQQQQQVSATNQPQPLTPQQHQLMIQQQQQLAKQQQQQIAQIQAQVRISQQHNQPPSSPMPPSPHVTQTQILSPHSMHSQPASPMPPRSPMISSSPIPRSPAVHQAPASNQQPPNSPMMHSNHQPPNSPMPRSPMIVGQIQSPMGMRRPPSTGSIPDRPKSVENPGTPRNSYHQIQDHDHTGGGNPHNPANPIPLPPGFGRFGYFKLGLRGGSPMWGYGRGAKRLPNGEGKEEKPGSSEIAAPPPKFKKESHVSRVTILKKKSPAKSNLQGLTRVGSLVSSDYNEFDDSSSTPPITPPPTAPSASGSTTNATPRSISRSIGKKLPPGSDHQNEQLQIIDRSPEEKQLSIMDYDDDTVISTEVSLSSVAQQPDCEEITVIESFSQTGLENFSSPLESDQITEDFLLFDISEKEMEDDENYHVNDNNVRFVLRSPTSSDDELGLQSKSKQPDTLTLNLIEGISTAQALPPPESPTATVEDTPTIDDNFEGSPHLVIIEAAAKSPEEISTKEDFEELIDEGSRKEKIIKPGIINSKHISEIHKYAAPNVYSFTPTPRTTVSAPSVQNIIHTNVVQNVRPNTINIRPTTLQGQKISLITTTPVITGSTLPTAKLNKNLMQNPKVQNNIASIIFPIKTTLRSNVIGVPKIVNSVAPAITIVSGTTTQIANIIPSHFTVPVISASAVSKLPNVKVIDKPSTSLSLTSDLPKKIFEDDSKSPDSSNCEEDKLKLEQHLNKIKEEHQQNEEDTLLRTKDAKEETDAGNETINKKEDGQKEMLSSGGNTKSPAKNKAAPMILHNPPELKMTAQVIQESQALIRSTTLETFITQAVEEVDGNSNDLDNKSVVISIPSPTPSQEQILDHISLQALENRRQDGKFEYFDTLLEMIEDMDKEEAEEKIDIFTPTVPAVASTTTIISKQVESEPVKVTVHEVKETNQIPVTIVTNTRATVMPQLSPLSQPSELTSNIANGSQQLRTLLSSFTTTVTSSSVGTISKSVSYKEKQTNLSTSQSLQTSRMVTQQQQQQQHNNAISSAANSVIVPNIKQIERKIVSPKTSPTTTAVVVTTTNTMTTTNTILSSQPQIFTTSILTTQSASTARNMANIQITSDHPKLSYTQPSQTSQINTTSIASEQKTPVTSQSVSVPITTSAPTRKTSLSLNEMLQSHPAATVPQTSPGTITTASILSSALPLSRSGFSAALVQAQPHVISSVTSSASSHAAQQSHFKATLGTTNLLHSQLTKTPVSRTRSFDEIFEKRIEKEADHPVATESAPSTPVSTQVTSSLITTSNLLKDIGGCKFSTLHPGSRLEDSQNVLLKQLLQNTACASLQTTTSTTVSTTTSLMTAPSLPIVPNLEAQLARPVPPTPSALIPPILQNDAPNQQLSQNQQHQHQHQPHQQQQPQNNLNTGNNNNNGTKSHAPSTLVQRQPIMTRETSFVSKPIIQNPPMSLPISTSQQSQQALHIDIKKALPPSRTPSRDDLLSPPTPRSTCSQDSNLTTPPLVIKKEPAIPTTLQSPLLTPQEVKKEFLDESSQHSEISDQSRCDVQMKEELMDIDTEKIDKEELKKMKRRMYQQKRRQNQILNKEIAGQPKKRPRKSSKVDEDYDSYIEGVLAQLRSLPPMVVSEPILNKNFGVVPTFGCGDLVKLGCKEYDSRLGDLKGSYGDAEVPGFSDYYSTKPYGDIDPLPEKPPSSTQRGFYDQEFSLIKFDTDEDRRFDFFSREDSPDSIISSSSPECPVFEPILKFPGLKLIDEEDEMGDETSNCMRPLSPMVPIIAPIPIRLKPNGPYLKDFADVDKENIGKDYHNLKPKFAPTPTTPLKDSGNVTVTLTLTSSAAEDIMGVLRDLANILHIPAPTSYQIVERTSTPPSQKLGLYRTKGKDGKEGAPIDIQSILNGAAKFCKHCDVVILNNMIRKKISELPFLSKDTELLGDGEELFFCSSTCYMQFALMHRSPSLTEDKAAAIVDHLCQKDKADHLRKKQVLERQRAEVYNFETVGRRPHYLEKMDIDLQIKKEEFPDDIHLDLIKPDCFLDRAQKIEEPLNKWRNLRYKKYMPGCLQPRAKYKKASDKETMELLYKLAVTVTPSKNLEDTRKCMFCHNVGDGVADGPARLLNFDVDKWVHLNCALWSDGVYETVNGALMHLENALQQSLVSTCIHCNNLGATIRCFKTRCSNIYHLPCAIKDRCVFYKNKTTYCVLHIPKNEKDNELTTLSVSRRVYVNRDENRQVAAVMHHSDQNNLLRVGSLIFLSVGQLLPHQLQNFHTANYIYPIGYKIVRFYWSLKHVNKRCRYICSIHEMTGRPEFRILVQDVMEEEMEFRDATAKGVWNKVIESIAVLRKENQCVHVFPKYVTGEDLFGLTEPAVVRVLESLPGIETLTNYKFKYGRNPLLELPLAINPSGAARTEPRLRNQLHWKRAHTQRTGSSARPVFAPTAVGSGEVACPYSKQFVHSKSSQYKKMKQEWRNNVYLARSKIQGLGLYAARDLEKHTMVIEYIGEIIRTELAETREKKYEAKNRGIYMFRLDEERVVDATLSGGLARYINHSCNPNCVAEIVEVDRDLRIIIFAKRRIQRGEELAYDYKFDIEDDQHKISCMCGAPNCRKWMN